MTFLSFFLFFNNIRYGVPQVGALKMQDWKMTILAKATTDKFLQLGL